MTIMRGARAPWGRRSRWLLTLTTVLLTPLALAVGAQAATAPDLGTASSFAVLAGSTVTNTGASVINGDLGVSPGLAVTGFPPGLVVAPGTIHAGDAVAAQAKSDTNTAFNSLGSQQCNQDLSGTDLGGLTLTPGVYCFSSSAQLTGALTLNSQMDPNAVFIFKISSTLTTASNSGVVFINGGSDCVFWQVGSSATLGTTTAFSGNILASASITMNTGASISRGRALAGSGAVTLDTNVISPSLCGSSPGSGTAATVRSFTAASSAHSALLKWRTASEVEMVGFNVYGQVHGKRVKLNHKLIAAKSTTGASYAFRYRAPSGQKAPTRFWLQSVNLDGSRVWSSRATSARRNIS